MNGLVQPIVPFWVYADIVPFGHSGLMNIPMEYWTFEVIVNGGASSVSFPVEFIPWASVSGRFGPTPSVSANVSFSELPPNVLPQLRNRIWQVMKSTSAFESEEYVGLRHNMYEHRVDDSIY
jgi:hypothetical protein